MNGCLESRRHRGRGWALGLTDRFLCAFSRHRGLIQAYAFAVLDQLAFQSTVPICRSACGRHAGLQLRPRTRLPA